MNRTAWKQEWAKGYFQATSDIGIGLSVECYPSASEAFKAGYIARMRY